MMYSGHQPPPPNYVMLANQYGGPPPPYYQHQPYPHHRPPRYQGRRSGGSCCIRCICCCYCLLFIFVFLVLSTLFLTYSFYKPKIPIYKLEDFGVTAFNVAPDMTVTTEFQVTVRAENPNTKIGFVYGRDNAVTVSYEDSILCTGRVPAFRQGHENVTLIKIPLSGKAPLGSGLEETLRSDQSEGRIPLLVQVRVPISVVLDSVPLRQFLFHVNCYLIIDSLKPDKKPRILSTRYTFGFGSLGF